MARWLLAACAPFLLGGCAHTGEAEPPSRELERVSATAGPVTVAGLPIDSAFYRPMPLADWPADVDRDAAACVVVVAAQFSGHPPRIFGNGVLLASGDADGCAEVLTCAHVVSRDGELAAEVRVGVFSISFASPKETDPDYQEIVADLRGISTTQDLALLTIPVERPLITVAESKSSPALPRARTFVSIVPFGRPGTRTSEFHFYLRKGQSGSPVFREGELYGILRGTGARGRIDRIVRANDISRFLASQVGAK